MSKSNSKNNISDNVKIGEYLDKLIMEHYPSRRQFCIDYIKMQGESVEEAKTNNVANRFAQVTKGKKSIQLYDLPILSALLGVSYEQILSAGTSGEPSMCVRPTNYLIAQSHSPEKWQAYIERDDKLILNPDEYGKTILDYAIEFQNLDLIKYLMENKYIWFDGGNSSQYDITFGAGTSIQRRDPLIIDAHLQCQLMTSDKLRMDIIALAVEKAVNKDDLLLLKEFRARELPELYYKSFPFATVPADLAAYNREELIEQISKASNVVIEYFTDEFQVRTSLSPKGKKGFEYTYVFPFLSELLDRMIKNHHPYLKAALEKSVRHNEKTELMLKKLVNQITASDNQGEVEDFWKHWTHFEENGGFVSAWSMRSHSGILTNIVHITERLKDPEINELIDRLNSSYRWIRDTIS